MPCIAGHSGNTWILSASGRTVGRAVHFVCTLYLVQDGCLPLSTCQKLSGYFTYCWGLARPAAEKYCKNHPCCVVPHVSYILASGVGVSLVMVVHGCTAVSCGEGRGPAPGAGGARAELAGRRGAPGLQVAQHGRRRLPGRLVGHPAGPALPQGAARPPQPTPNLIFIGHFIVFIILIIKLCHLYYIRLY